MNFNSDLFNKKIDLNSKAFGGRAISASGCTVTQNTQEHGNSWDERVTHYNDEGQITQISYCWR